MLPNTPLIIAFASPKGGVGKSTSCLALAGALAARHHPVHIIDLDQTQTLWRWYSNHRPNIPGLTVESAPEADFMEHLKALYHQRRGFILIDVAGALAKVMMQAATVAHLTITPAKLSEPDILEANKLHRQLLDLGKYAGKTINHRILINEVAALLPSYQRHTLAEIHRSPLKRFDTLMHVRAPYAEGFLTGLPPHFSDRNRPPVQKAVHELDALTEEVLAALGVSQQKAAA